MIRVLDSVVQSLSFMSHIYLKGHFSEFNGGIGIQHGVVVVIFHHVITFLSHPFISKVKLDLKKKHTPQ